MEKIINNLLYKVLHNKNLWSMLFCAGYALMAIIGIVDYLTGYETRISGLYIFPIMILALVSEFPAAMVAVALAVLVKGISDLNIEGSLQIVAWNSALTFFTYSILVILLIRFRNRTVKDRRIAITDNLTGLYNLAGFYEIAGLELAQSKRYERTMSLLYFDCDKFKLINDSLGHSVGDRLLKLVGEILKTELRETDYSFRWGGDEFVILLADSSEEESGIVAKKVNERLLSAMKTNNWDITFSIGVATFINRPEDLDEMLVKADQLMYIAKKEGGNSIRYATY